MTDLLTAKDVEVKAFKKVSFGGYAIQEVEDFLNQIADDLEAYALRLNERENRIMELEEYVKKQESMADMIKDALLQARKSAKEMEDQARARTDAILDEARQEADKVMSDAGVKVQDAEKSAAGIIAEANIKARELEAQARIKLEDAEKTASEIVTRAKIESDDIIRKANDMQRETEKQWDEFEQELALRRKDAAEEADRTIYSAKAEAHRILDESSKAVEEYDTKIRYLNLQKQQFLKDTVSLLMDFSQVIDRAQHEFAQEMERERPDDRNEDDQSGSSQASRKLIDRFRKNLLEGKIEDRKTDSGSGTSSVEL